MAEMMPVLDGKHVQAKIRPAEYRWLKQGAKARGLTIQQAVREAIREWGIQHRTEDPWEKYVGFIRDAPADIADNIDDIYLED